jgi:crotonobetainyl-CoA:carnitine CoA-transferase CaiB-like acyl-CoA transferase
VLATYVRLGTGTGTSADVALFDAAAWLTQDSWFGDEERPPPRLVRADDGLVVVDAPGTGALPEGSIAAVLEALAETRVPAAPLQDVTAVVRHPQVLERRMVIEQRHGESVLLNTGDHLRSLRRAGEPLALAPVAEDDPTWRCDSTPPTATTTPTRGRR